jgi:demethylmenaquinone methyltransferase/2-methoxy-6-polyprenyl-1,4-benzoquinol methylase
MNITNNSQIGAVTRSKQQAKTIYDRLSRWYDLLIEPGEQKFRDAGLQKLQAAAGEKILEIGCGPGGCLRALAQSVSNSGQVYGLDISVGMLNISQHKLSRAGLSDKVALTCGDAVQLPFAANSFEAILMSFTLELFNTSEMAVVLRGCQRVLRREGRICVIALSRQGKASLAIRLYEWARQKFPKYVDCRPIFGQKTLAEAGFQTLDVTEMSMWGLPVEIVLAKRG